jgi:nucleoside phosphorylase
VKTYLEMANNQQPDDFHVGWICAVQTEYVVACELLDEEYLALPYNSLHDNNTYTFGRMSQHNIVIACLPKGKYGLTSAASVAKDMLRSFPSIRFGLMVGIAGGAPSKKYDIRLGDVVVSSPTGRTGGVIHYEFGKTIQNQRLERTGALDAPPMMLLTALSVVSARHERKGHRIAETVQGMVDHNARLRKKYGRPQAGMDRLYDSTFVHPDREQTCEEVCKEETARLVQRQERAADEDDPVVHYGLIASADRLMKDAQIRDTLACEEGVLCFEMEAAGLMDHFPCVVIRGICDYSDTHKNDIWQGYAAATAAAYAKELLEVIQPTEVDHLPSSISHSRSGGITFNNYDKVQNQVGEQHITGNLVFN